MYELLKPWLFRQDPENVHERVMHGLAWLGQRGPSLELIRRFFSLGDPRLEVAAFGLRFPNPIGLAAGFDKNAVAVRTWAALGFGHVEIGSVTALPQPGNPRPRLFRLPQDQALINRMGFNNEGAEAIAQRLERLQQTFGRPPVPLGINLGKSRVTPWRKPPGLPAKPLPPLALWRLLRHQRKLPQHAGPPGLAGQSAAGRAAGRAHRVCAGPEAPAAQNCPRPDLGTDRRDSGPGGRLPARGPDRHQHHHRPHRPANPHRRSRRPFGQALAGALARGAPIPARAATRPPAHCLGGGIFSPEDVWQRLENGATLVQVYTGLVYEGPLMVKKLCRGLLQRMEREGVRSLKELSSTP